MTSRSALEGERKQVTVLFAEVKGSMDLAEQVNFRPEYRAAWRQAPSSMQLPLVPMGEEAICELLADLLGNHASVSGLAAMEHLCAAGNPFLVEEMCRPWSKQNRSEAPRG